MKVRTTIRSLFMILIAVAAAAFILFPYVSYHLDIVGYESQESVVYFYHLLELGKSFNPIFEVGDSPLILIREISSYLTIIAICSAGFVFLTSLARIVMYKNKFISVVNGFAICIMTFAIIGLGGVSIAYGYVWKAILAEGLFSYTAESMVIQTLGGWLYAGLGLFVPVTIILTNLIKK